MPKELTTEVVRGYFYTLILIGRLDGSTPPEMKLITLLKKTSQHFRDSDCSRPIFQYRKRAFLQPL